MSRTEDFIMTYYCPKCGQNRGRSEDKEWSEDGGEWSPDKVNFLSVQIACNNCGYGWNCVGTKKVK